MMLITVIVPVSVMSGKATCKKSALARTARQTHMVKKKKIHLARIPSPGSLLSSKILRNKNKVSMSGYLLMFTLFSLKFGKIKVDDYFFII